MAQAKLILLIGASSYDIQVTANSLAGETLFPEPKTTHQFYVKQAKSPYGETASDWFLVAPGFVDDRRNVTARQVKQSIKRELQEPKYGNGFHRVVVVLR